MEKLGTESQALGQAIYEATQAGRPPVAAALAVLTVLLTTTSSTPKLSRTTRRTLSENDFARGGDRHRQTAHRSADGET